MLTTPRPRSSAARRIDVGAPELAVVAADVDPPSLGRPPPAPPSAQLAGRAYERPAGAVRRALRARARVLRRKPLCGAPASSDGSAGMASSRPSRGGRHSGDPPDQLDGFRRHRWLLSPVSR